VKRLIGLILGVKPDEEYGRVLCRIPEPPMGFVPRSDPNFFYLARKF
jgi:hypothetical protein